MADNPNDISVGDLIRWRDPDYPYFMTDDEFYFSSYKHGIVIEIHDGEHFHEYWDIYYEPYPYGYEEKWMDDISWIKVLTIGSNLKKRYLYLQFGDIVEIVSKIRT